MYVWILLIGGSALVGLLSAVYIKEKWSIFVAGSVPWLTLLAALIYTEYFSDWEKGGLGAWVLAQILGGTIAAAIGIASWTITQKYLK